VRINYLEEEQDHNAGQQKRTISCSLGVFQNAIPPYFLSLYDCEIKTISLSLSLGCGEEKEVAGWMIVGRLTCVFAVEQWGDVH